MARRPPFLTKIIDLARDQRIQGKRLKAIFDLDSTLFDVSPRITKILHAFAELPEIRSRYPLEAGALSRLTPHTSDYGVRRTLERVGFVAPDEDFIKSIVTYWKKQFFANQYLKYDVPYPGAREFVADLYKAGADILYLTGRDVPRMLRGTLESLKQWHFPLDPDHANLILKPTTEETDSSFKKEFFLKMDKSSPEVWFFENEPTNIELVLQTSPHIKVVFVETVHSGKTPPPGAHVPRISGFEI